MSNFVLFPVHPVCDISVIYLKSTLMSYPTSQSLPRLPLPTGQCTLLSSRPSSFPLPQFSAPLLPDCSTYHPDMPALIPSPHSCINSFQIRLSHDDFLPLTKSLPPTPKLGPSTHTLTPNPTLPYNVIYFIELRLYVFVLPSTLDCKFLEDQAPFAHSFVQQILSIFSVFRVFYG